MSVKNTYTLLGNKLDGFAGYRALYDYLIERLLQSTESGYITVNNVSNMMEGHWDASFQDIINNSYLAITDGKPLQIMGLLKGKKGIERLFGPTIMERFMDWGREHNIRHFLFGSSEENLCKMREAIEAKYPGAIIAGMISPPYTSSQEWDNDSFLRQINAAKPNFIWIGLGAPKQEHWMAEHIQKLDRGFMFGIGAGFAYLAGETKHAPAWMKNLSLEWAYRLVQEPKRLWKRYLKTIPPFLFLASLELAGVTFHKKRRKTGT